MKKAARAARVHTAADASSSAEHDGWVVRQMSDHLHFNEFLICFLGFLCVTRFTLLRFSFFLLSLFFSFCPSRLRVNLPVGGDRQYMYKEGDRRSLREAALANKNIQNWPCDTMRFCSRERRKRATGRLKIEPVRCGRHHLPRAG